MAGGSTGMAIRDPDLSGIGNGFRRTLQKAACK
jgi:hypothetical protein